MMKRVDYKAIERQDAADPAPAGHYWIRDIDGSNRRLVTLAQYKAEIAAARETALKNFREITHSP